MKKLKFPKDFLWGTATSAYQVEGGIENCDWARAFPAGKACDHYNCYNEDFDLMKKLNQNAYRFSIEWSRIEPEQGKFDKKEIEHYRRVLKALKERDIKTMVTLHHFTTPLWLAKMNGWENRAVVAHFSRFAQKAFQEYQDLVDFWITINEPLMYLFFGGLIGLWKKRWLFREKAMVSIFQEVRKEIFEKGRVPLGRVDFVSAFRVLRNQVSAHKKVYNLFHEADDSVKVGLAKNNQFFEPFSTSPLDKLSAFLADYFWNKLFLNRVSDQLDFIGLNYYFHNRMRFPFRARNENKVVSDLGWEVYPEGIYHVLKDLKKYGLPIYITENGMADKKDKLRKEFIKEHLYWVHKAIQEGVDVRGYFHWSLLDNIEWDLGREPRFGLVEVDYETMERKPRPSAFYYAKICKENALKYE